MSLECGIVGLPNVGKSTLFNTLTSAEVAAENFPFCTVDPNKGIVEVPDDRMKELVKIVKPQRTVPATVTFVDIAGLVKGASKGEGLGNQFLSNIREVDAICHVVRCFEDGNITHVMGSVDPVRDAETIDLELCLADAEAAFKRAEKLSKNAKSGNKEAIAEHEFMTKLAAELNQGRPLRSFIKELGDNPGLDLRPFLTGKPLMYVANIAESDVKEMSAETQGRIDQLKTVADKDGANLIVLSNSLEYQLSQLSGEDLALFSEEYGMKEPGLNRLIREAYELLGLITYFTAGEKEVRAWTIEKGDSAQEAAGVIHSDFARGFIRAEVIHYPDFLSCGGEKLAREKGLMRSEGKEYTVLDGDVMHFRFNV